MVEFAFDTLKAAKALKEAGFGEAQAEAVVVAVGSAMGENVATKADLDALKTALEAAFKADLAALEARFYRHLWIMAAGIVSVTVTLVKLIP